MTGWGGGVRSNETPVSSGAERPRRDDEENHMWRRNYYSKKGIKVLQEENEVKQKSQNNAGKSQGHDKKRRISILIHSRSRNKWKAKKMTREGEAESEEMAHRNDEGGTEGN